MGNGAEVSVRTPTRREYGELEKVGGRGWLLIANNDIAMPFGETDRAHLKKFARHELPGAPIPMSWQRFIPWDMEFLLDQGSRLGHAGLNIIDQQAGEDGQVHGVLINEGPHVYETDQQVNIGKLVVKSQEPLKGDAMLKAFHDDVYRKPHGYDMKPDEGIVWVPVTKRFAYTGEEKTLRLEEFPRAHDRSKLYPYLGIKPVEEIDDMTTVLESTTHLAATDQIGFSRDFCMWVKKGLKVVDGRFTEVEHGASRLLKPGDNPWRIMTETLGEIDFIGLELYKSLTV